jgi:protein O-GlcNAc transferase
MDIAYPPSPSIELARKLLARERPGEALEAANEAIARSANDTEARLVAGIALVMLGRARAALEMLDRALLQNPALARAHAARGLALAALGSAPEALAAYAKAAELDPKDPDTFVQIGQLMVRLGRIANAEAAFAQALASRADDAEALEGSAATLAALDRHDEAVERFHALAALRPDDAQIAARLFHAKLQCCDWSDYEDSRASLAARVGRGEHAGDPFSFLVHADCPAAQRRCAEIESARRFSIRRPISLPPSGRDRARLRIAYLSADFKAHPVGQLLAGVLESHDRHRFEIFALSASADDGSDIRRRIVAACEHFEDVASLPDAALAVRIAELGIDIAVDLGGHTQGSRTRALAHRPAPVQLQFLGFPGTLGASFVDYIVADRRVIPEELRGHYTEQVIYLPGSYLPGERPRSIAPMDRRAAGLPEEAFVFCAFHAPYKHTPGLFAAWMRILQEVPRSVLWLRETSAVAHRRLAAEAERLGIDPRRLIAARRTPSLSEHHARLRLADLFLDTHPYNAHSTARDALAAGVPVVTLAGRTFCSRVGMSLLQAADLGELAVTNPGDYERLAVDLALDRDRLEQLRRRLDRSHALCDQRRFCAHLEQAYLGAWRRYRRGEAPATFEVAPAPGSNCA